MTLDQFLGIECFSLKRYTRKNILSKVVLSHISSYESTCPNFENESESHSVMSDSLWPHVLYSPWNSLGQNTGVGSLFLLQGIFPNPGIECRSPALQADSLPAEQRGKPKNTGVGSLSFFQGISPIQESNQGLLHCRQILYQLSYAPTLNPINLSV